MDLVFKSNFKIGIRNIFLMVMNVFIMSASFFIVATLSLEDHYILKSMDSFMGMVLIIIYITITILFIIMQSVHAKWSIKFGSTRQSIFISNQILKMVASFLLMASFFVVNYFVGLIYGIESIYILQADIKIMLFLTVIFFSTVGELIGVIITYYNKVGRILYIVLILLFGGVYGVVSSSMIFDYIVLNINMLRFELFSAGIYTVTTAIMSGISWFMFSKYSIN